MKKIITVLMVLMVATSMFAETKVLFNNKIEERVAYTDTSFKKQTVFPELTTDEEILYIADELSKKIKIEEKELEFITYDFVKLDKYAKEYSFYFIADNKLDWAILFIKMNDETQAVIYYKIKPTK